MDINKIWKSQVVPQPDIENLRSRIEAFKSNRIRKVWFINLALILTCFFVLAIGFSAYPKYITTWLGIVLTVLSMGIILLVYSKIIPLYKSLDNQCSNSEFMVALLAIKEKEAFLSKQMMNLYFVLLSLGIGLYMIEYVMMMELKWGILAYVVTIVWFVFNWLVLRPKQINKQQEGLSSIIEDLKSVSRQLK